MCAITLKVPYRISIYVYIETSQIQLEPTTCMHACMTNCNTVLVMGIHYSWNKRCLSLCIHINLPGPTPQTLDMPQGQSKPWISPLIPKYPLTSIPLSHSPVPHQTSSLILMRRMCTRRLIRGHSLPSHLQNLIMRMDTYWRWRLYHDEMCCLELLLVNCLFKRLQWNLHAFIRLYSTHGQRHI